MEESLRNNWLADSVQCIMRAIIYQIRTATSMEVGRPRRERMIFTFPRGHVSTAVETVSQSVSVNYGGKGQTLRALYKVNYAQSEVRDVARVLCTGWR